jgi:hypothetical protein
MDEFSELAMQMLEILLRPEGTKSAPGTPSG